MFDLNQAIRIARGPAKPEGKIPSKQLREIWRIPYEAEWPS